MILDVVHLVTPEVDELQGYTNFPYLDLNVDRTRLLPNGVLEITYGLSPALQSTLEIHRRLQRDREVLSERSGRSS